MVVKKHKKKILFALLFLIIFSISFIFTHNNDKITKLLKTKDYNYLPEKAKQYIKEQYEKSGYIILTKKNKQENMPYLNPHYVERAEKYNVVPSAVILDYVSGGEKNNKTYPETFDLRNVDGVDYTTPNRNQSTSSLCAFFATTGTLESNLLYQSRTAYSNSALKFSERQLDYATSSGGIIEYPQSKGRELLIEGANFEELARVAKNGLGFVNLNKQPFDLSKNQKEISDILNFENSEYELNEAINFPFLDTATANESDINNYVNMIKDYVITYGGVYVATGSPQGGCAYYDSSINNYLIYDTNETREDDACILNYHAMEIIGWDDSRECWLVKTSWGPNWGDKGTFWVSYNDYYISRSCLSLNSFVSTNDISKVYTYNTSGITGSSMGLNNGEGKPHTILVAHSYIHT